MNHCLFKAKDTKGAVGNTVDYSSLTYIKHLWHVSAFLWNREFLEISCSIKNPASTGFFIQQIRDH